MGEALEAMRVALTDFAPRLVGAAVVLAISVLVALLLQRLAARFVERIGLDELFERTGTTSSLERIGIGASPSAIFGYVVFWSLLLAGAGTSLSILGLSSLQENMDMLVVLAGKALVAVLILAAGLVAAGWLSELTVREAESARIAGGVLFGRAVFAAVLTVAALLAAAQMGVEVSLLVVLAVVMLGTAGLVAALALGLGLAPLSGSIAAGRYARETLREGDLVSVDGIEGTVERIGYASVTLRSEDGLLHHIPNRRLLESVVTSRRVSEE
ncbi:MAG: mechanosensitive ion channel domain-containing protein [Actinomycetota bacterium]